MSHAHLDCGPRPRLNRDSHLFGDPTMKSHSSARGPNLTLRGVVLLCGIVLLSGCGVSTLRVRVPRPAEIDLGHFKKIAIGEVTGPHAQDVAEELTSSLVQTGRFDVLDRANLGQVLNEYNLSASGLVNPQSAVRLGQLIGAAALVFVRVSEYRYREKMSRGSPWTDKKGEHHQLFQRTGTATVSIDFQITDLTTGSILVSKNIRREDVRTTSADNQRPARIEADDLLIAARNAAIYTFMTMIAPHWAYVTTTLLSDKKIPELARGISYARNGTWDYAIASFKTGVDNHPGQPHLDKAYYDLGVAYEYTNDYESALEMLNKAYSIKPDGRYANEIANCRTMQSDYTRWRQQLQEK